MHSSHPSQTASRSTLMLVHADEMAGQCCGAWVRNWALSTYCAAARSWSLTDIAEVKGQPPILEGDAHPSNLLRRNVRCFISRCGRLQR